MSLRRENANAPGRASFACLVLGIVAIGMAAPAAASATGSISGHVTDGNAPLAGVCIWVSDTDFHTVGNGATNASGDYTIADVPAGSGYRARFSDCTSSPPTPATHAYQWYDGKSHVGDAT